MTPRVWVLRDALDYELARHEGLGRAVAPLYTINREARRELCASVLENTYADSHCAGGYTLTREDG